MNLFKTLIMAVLFLFMFSGCAFIGEVFEGNFDNRDEYQQAVIEELNEHNLPDDVKAKLQIELFELYDKYAEIVADYDDLREALKARIISTLLSG